MNKGRDQLEILWDSLLSRQPQLIKVAFGKLQPADQQAVLLHLQRMVSESGWQPEQRLSAEVALDVIDRDPGQEK